VSRPTSEPPSTYDAPRLAARLYLDLLKKCLTRTAFEEAYKTLLLPSASPWKRPATFAQRVLRWGGLDLVMSPPPHLAARIEGHELSLQAANTVEKRQLNNLEDCIANALSERVPGDLIEVGACRSGAATLMRGVLKAYGDRDRVVWLANDTTSARFAGSFRGLPKPHAVRYPMDAVDRHGQVGHFVPSIDDVKAELASYDLLDHKTRFLVGSFRDTLLKAPIEGLSVLRLAGGVYESTIVALEALYPKVSPGGYVIVDACGLTDGCRSAVDDYRRSRGIAEELRWIDWVGAFWRQSQG
jgi:O-methyltransferase